MPFLVETTATQKFLRRRSPKHEVLDVVLLVEAPQIVSCRVPMDVAVDVVVVLARLVPQLQRRLTRLVWETQTIVMLIARRKEETLTIDAEKLGKRLKTCLHKSLTLSAAYVAVAVIMSRNSKRPRLHRTRLRQ